MTLSMVNISAQKVKLSVYELDCLIAHPICAAKCAGYLSIDSYENASLCLESDPAIALAVINLCREKDVPVDLGNLDFSSLLKQLSKTDLLRMLLTLKVYNTEDTDVLSLMALLIRHSAIRAFGAKLIAEKAGHSDTSEICTAALFADVGLFALAQLFTKSLLMLRQESNEQKVSLLKLQQEHLGITDNVLSRMLLQKWEFGDSIADTAWLYKTNADGLTDKMPCGKIISIVRLADMLCDPEYQNDRHSLIQWPFLTDSDINEIKGKNAAFAGQINELLGLENENPSQLYWETIKQIYFNQLTANPSAGDEATAFVQKFTDCINPQAKLIDVATISAKAIFEIFSAQNVCVFIAMPYSPKSFLTAVVSDSDTVTQSLIESPEGIVPDKTWFCRQAGIEPNNDKSLLMPIKNGEKVIGGIIYRGSVFDNKQLELISGFIAKISLIINRNEYEESIGQSAVDCLGQSKPQSPAAVEQPVQKETLAETAAELAAGAAHELNNPLAVISGRAQLLAQSETDETKKLVLNQIAEKAKDIHEIVGQLMNYAKPAQPQVRTVSPFIVLNNALEKVNARYLSEPLDIHLENIESLGDVEIDGEQVAEALTEIIYNALESYESGNGPVEIAGKEQSGFIEIRIKDSGCGMSDETIQKAARPFYSDKPAGRQRGMGLSLASSYLKNNNCTLKIESQLEKGTTVTINLPRAGI